MSSMAERLADQLTGRSNLTMSVRLSLVREYAVALSVTALSPTSVRTHDSVR